LKPLLHLHKHGRIMTHDSTCAFVQVKMHQQQLLCWTQL